MHDTNDLRTFGIFANDSVTIRLDDRIESILPGHVAQAQAHEALDFGRDHDIRATLFGKQLENDTDVRTLELHADRRRLRETNIVPALFDDLAMGPASDCVNRVTPGHVLKANCYGLFNIRIRNDIDTNLAADELEKLREILVPDVQVDPPGVRAICSRILNGIRNQVRSNVPFRLILSNNQTRDQEARNHESGHDNLLRESVHCASQANRSKIQVMT